MKFEPFCAKIYPILYEMQVDAMSTMSQVKTMGELIVTQIKCHKMLMLIRQV